jgi:hypothetical protein
MAVLHEKAGRSVDLVMTGATRVPPDSRRKQGWSPAVLAALFIGALIASLGYAGTSPIASLDTWNEEREIQQCVVSDSCTLDGMGTSLPYLEHGVGWLDFRTLLAWTGAGVDGAHFVMQLLNSAAVVLVFYLAAQLGGGPLAGALAVGILQFGIGPLCVTRTELYNSSPLLFLGAVLVLACTAAAQRPCVAAVVLAALVAAVMANDHLACILTGASVAWVALLAPRRPVRLAAVALATFALAAFVLAPPVWLHDVAALLQHRESIRHVIAGPTLRYNELMLWASLALGAWVVSLVSRAPAWTEYRRRAQGALAVLVPFLAAFLAASRYGIVADAKYLAHVKAACAILAALPLTLIAEPALRKRLARPRMDRIERLLPFATALLIAIPPNLGRLESDARSPTFRDVDRVFHILRDEHGWDFPSMLSRVKGPSEVSIVTGLRDLSVATDPPATSAADDGVGAVLLVLEPGEMPQPLPTGWSVVHRSSRATTVLIVMPSRIDWRRFDVRVEPVDVPAGPWVGSSLWLEEPRDAIGVPNLPPPSAGVRGTLRIRLPLRPAAPGSTDEIFLPRLGDVCGGYIGSTSTAGLEVAPDRRHAVLVAPEPGQPSPASVELEWQLGSPECSGWAYDGLPPFFVEGDAANVRLLEAVFRGRERG